MNYAIFEEAYQKVRHIEALKELHVAPDVWDSLFMPPPPDPSETVNLTFCGMAVVRRVNFPAGRFCFREVEAK